METKPNMLTCQSTQTLCAGPLNVNHQEEQIKLSISEEQQHEMRRAYYDGAPGVLVSGLVWISAALVCYQLGGDKGVWALLIGGALIHPISIIVTKAIGRPAKTSKANALNQLGMATIGSRYLIFASMYGRSIFWVMRVSLILTGYLVFFAAVTPVVAAGLGRLIEVLFAFLVFSKASRPAASLKH